MRSYPPTCENTICNPSMFKALMGRGRRSWGLWSLFLVLCCVRSPNKAALALPSGSQDAGFSFPFSFPFSCSQILVFDLSLCLQSTYLPSSLSLSLSFSLSLFLSFQLFIFSATELHLFFPVSVSFLLSGRFSFFQGEL